MMNEIETVKQTTKRLRQYSKKFFKYAIEKANHKCSICGFGSEKFNFLHVHHIYPIKDYCIDFRVLGGTPTTSFEKVTLVALCPNCHMIVHRLKDAVNDEHKERLKIEIERMSGDEGIRLAIFYSERINLYFIARKMGHDDNISKNIVLNYGLQHSDLMGELKQQEEKFIQS
jgi:rubredoxin